MEFHRFITMEEVLQQYGCPKDKAKDLINRLRYVLFISNKYNTGSASQGQFEYIWQKKRKPYYNIYPSVIPLLTKIDLNFPSNKVELPSIGCICFRFPKKNPLHPIKSVLVANTKTKEGEGVGLLIDMDEVYHDLDLNVTLPLYTYLIFPLDENPVIDNILNVPVESGSFSAPDFTKGILLDVIKVIITSFLIVKGGDDLLINPDVLGKDEYKFKTATPEQKKTIVERAFRRRGPGWEIGKYYEKGPYVVPPHPQRYWIGKGRTKVIVKTRSGYTVHKDQITKLPTGFEDE